jgi:hypothetical protein
MLAIAGDSAAGKTTLTKGLVEALGPDRCVSVCVDDYHRYDRVERKGKPFTALHPDCNYVEIMEQHLQLLATGQPILKPVYDHATGLLARPELVERVVRAQWDPTWRQPFEAIRIAGNVYYVGTRGLSSFLIVTPGGGIIIDSGEAESVPFIRANIERLGFRLSDVKVLLTGHAHFDHVGGHAELKRLTGARVMVMDADRQALESGIDRSALGGPGWKPVAIDRVLKDGDTVALGGYTLTAHLTPGHTQGCTTWTMETMQDGRKYQVAFACSVTINEGVHLINVLLPPSLLPVPEVPIAAR